MIPANTPFQFGRANEVQDMLAAAFEDDHAFNLQGGDKIRLGWMPFQLADFISIMTEVMRETNGVHFLEVGSGVGTKCLVAKGLFGLSTIGIEYNESLATVALQKGRGPVRVEDALTTQSGVYTLADIIWMYRCFRDPVLQGQLEQRIYNEAKSGAIFAGAALENAPEGWATIVDDLDIGVRGAWRKP